MMNITPYNGPFISSWLQGHIDCSYSKLVKVFGEPHSGGDGYKVDAEWNLMTPAGIATIYNYKDGINYNGESGTPVAGITDWHVGGTVEDVVDYILDALDEVEDDKEEPKGLDLPTWDTVTKESFEAMVSELSSYRSAQ